MKYFNFQTKSYNCVPVACLNALIWGGLDINNPQALLKLAELEIELGTTKDGTDDDELYDFIHRNFDSRNSYNFSDSIKAVKRNENMAIFISFTEDYEEESHCAFSDGYSFPNNWLRPSTLKRASKKMQRFDYVIEIWR